MELGSVRYPPMDGRPYLPQVAAGLSYRDISADVSLSFNEGRFKAYVQTDVHMKTSATPTRLDSVVVSSPKFTRPKAKW